MAWDIDIADVVAGQPITSTWGNLIRDRVTHVVATTAALPTDIADGSLAYVSDTDELWLRRAGVWVPLGGTVKLGSVSLVAPAATIDFPSIPQTMSALRLVANLRGDNAANLVQVWCRFNGVETANYDNQTMNANGTTLTGVNNAADTGVRLAMPGSTAFAAYAAPVTVDIPDYRQGSTFRRHVLYTNGRITGADPTAMVITTGLGLWRSTTAITRVTLAPGSGNFVAGSTATLYGFT